MDYQNIYHLVSTQARLYQDKIFAIFPEEKSTITYNELFTESVAFASYLESKGALRLSRVAILATKSRSSIIAYVGCLCLGVLTLFIDEKLNFVDVNRMLLQYKVNFLLHDDYFAEMASSLILKLDPPPLMIPIAIPPIKSSEVKWSNFLSYALPTDPAICVYTSGSTGKSKGIISTHQNIFWGVQSLQISLRLTPHDRVLSVTPLSGTNGQIFTFWSPFYTGGSGIYYQGMFAPFRLFKYADLYKATWLNATPTYYSLINASKLKSTQFELNLLRFARTSSAPLPQNVQDEFEQEFKIPLVDSLGLSETTGQVFVNAPDFQQRRKSSVGRPVLTEYKIVNLTNGQEIYSSNEVGEIIVRCGGLMAGYLDDSSGTAEVIKDGWLWTGDLGYRDEEGFIYLKGRKKDIAIVGGKNVSLTEIDNLLYTHPSVTNATCFGVPDDFRGEKIIAFVTISELVPNPSSISNDSSDSTNKLCSNIIKDIINHCHKNISAYKCPQEIYVVSSFPLGGGGKIPRAKVKEWYLEGKTQW